MIQGVAYLILKIKIEFLISVLLKKNKSKFVFESIRGGKG